MKAGVFAKAVVVIAALFALTLLFGYAIESEKYAQTEARINALSDDLENALLFSLFIQTHNSSASMCGVLKTELEGSAQRTYNLYGELANSQGNVFRQYEELKTKYFLANMRFYLMLREYRQECGDGNLEPILFFYSATADCPACSAQGNVLDEVRQECASAHVYAFPADAESVPMIKAFKEYYGISQVPSLVIRDRTHAGLMNKSAIEATIGCT